MLRSKLLRLRGSQGAPPFRLSLFPDLKRKVSNSVSAVQDTYLSTKQIFERHRVVFTISTSLASLLTAWAGYSLRYHHQAKVEKRLDSIEQTLKNSSDVRHEEIKRIVSSGGVSNSACLATAWTTLVIGCLGRVGEKSTSLSFCSFATKMKNCMLLGNGRMDMEMQYGLGWRSGSWFAQRKFQRAQMKLLEQNKPGRWQLLKKKLSKPRILKTIPKSVSPSSSLGAMPHRNANPSAASPQQVSQIS